MNLCNSETSIEPLEESLFREYLGGRGLGIALLSKEISATIDPLSANAKIVFSTGPLTGTMAPGSSRVSVNFKSPLTGAYGFSLSGGHFGAEFKYAGYDALILEGQAESPRMLIIEDDRAELRNADDYWGMNCIDAQDAIRRDLDKDFEIAAIGPAGENLVKYASILFGRRAAGRCGGGAVLGSKRLKAIAIRGEKDLELRDLERFDDLVKKIVDVVRKDPEMVDYRNYGTPSLVETLNEFGMLPTRNFQTGIFDSAEKISGERMRETLVSRDSACFSCPVACGKVSSVNYKGKAYVTEGPEYETIYALGSDCGNDNLRSIALADLLCDQLGMDTMSVGNVIAFMMECRERNLLKGRLADFDMSFGEHARLAEMIEMIASRQGIGAQLAEGVRYLSRVVGADSEQFAMHVKGLELGGYDPRGAKGMGLAMATCERGGCHHAGGYTIYDELFSGKLDRFSHDGKGSLVSQLRKKQLIFDSVIMCVFYGGVVDLTTIAALLECLSGSDFSASMLKECAVRISNAERSFNHRAGLKRIDDDLPQRLKEAPMPEGPSEGQVVKLNVMLEDFYAASSWNSESAEPS